MKGLPKQIPICNTIEELQKVLNPLYIISDYTNSDYEYKVFEETIYNIVKGCFRHKDLREYKVKFKFYKTDKETYELELRHFLINLFLWFPFVELSEINGVMNKDIIINCKTQINNKSLSKYINEVTINALREYNVKYTSSNYHISETLFNLRRISLDFSIIMGLNMSTELFIDMYKKYPRMQEIMTTTFPDDMQPSDVEHELEKLMNEVIEIFKGDTNVISVILNAGTGIKNKQLSEFIINGGFKPSLDGKTIPIAINSNTMIGGLNTPSKLFIDANGARKSLIMNKKVMGRAGHFGKIVTMLARTLSLSKTVSNCDTKHYVTYFVTNQKFLNKLDGRFFRRDNLEDFRPINAKKDTHLIGKYVMVKSPTKCSLGDEVCARCYGIKANINLDIADGISAFGSQEITKVVK